MKNKEIYTVMDNLRDRCGVILAVEVQVYNGSEGRTVLPYAFKTSLN